MFNILIISHGEIAEGFLNTAKMVMGNIENVRAIGINSGESRDEFAERLEKKAKEIYSMEGLLVLVDLYGGTPCNVSIIKLLNTFERIQIISGFNFPMLLEALNCRNNSLKDVTKKLIKIAKSGIIDVNQFLNTKKDNDEDE